jgi:hypothetical protein
MAARLSALNAGRPLTGRKKLEDKIKNIESIKLMAVNKQLKILKITGSGHMWSSDFV